MEKQLSTLETLNAIAWFKLDKAVQRPDQISLQEAIHYLEIVDKTDKLIMNLKLAIHNTSQKAA